MAFITLTGIGLQGLNGFVSEALCLFGIFSHEWASGRWPVRGVIASLTVVLGAWYMLTMLQHVLFGPVKVPEHGSHAPVTDLDLREVTILAPIAALCLLLGVYPQPVLRSMEPDLQVIADIADRARTRAQQDAVATRLRETGELTASSAGSRR